MHLHNLGRGIYKSDLVLETKDELEDIANTLNDMSMAVLVREQEILIINKELEERAMHHHWWEGCFLRGAL